MASGMEKVSHQHSAKVLFHENYGDLTWSNLRKTALSVLMAIFPGEPALAGFPEAKDDGNGGDNWSYKSCKASVTSSPPIRNLISADALPVTQSTVSKH